LFVDEVDQSLRLHPSARGVSPEIIASLRIPLNQGITGWVVRKRLPVRVGDVTADPRYAVAVGMPGAASEMAAPLVTGERVIGVVNVESPRLNAFSGDDLRLLTTLAGQLATIFEKARLDAALEEERALLARRVEERTAELNIANAELRQAARAKDEFLASMSHELRTPLNAILGISEALQEQVFGPLNEKQLRYLHTIEESGQHLLALINDILDLSKVEAGKVELQISRVVVESVCRASLQFIKEAAHKKQVKVSSTLDNKVSTMQADERRLKQILVNLLSNAVKFTPEGGDVDLEVLGDAERQLVHFIVWDTGIGITRENIGRLFQPFVQLDSSLSRQYSGTGLGLSLVKRLAELHGGSVSVESDVGKGSRFTVSLPWRVVSEEKRVADNEERIGKDWALDARHSASVAVLLAEDNETNLTAMSDYLSAKGYRVIVARNGHEVIRRVREDLPDVILMDIQMPGMDGLEAIRHIRAEPDPRVAQVPIIALTAIAMSGDRQRCMEAGANEYLSKPVSLRELVKVIEAQLREA
jgi:signal transduction histidine kinase/ActR/RegA family two-component response regulator